MSIFVSYARADHEAVRILEQDLGRTRAPVWIDRELEGGQAWWDVILGQIRSCELFVFALSPNSLRSRACQAELSYAVALGRPLMPVMVERVAVQLAPRPIADAHIIDYTERTPESAVSLVTSVMGRHAPPPLPNPLPPAPPTPMSYLNPYRERIGATELSYQQQAQLVIELRHHLDDHDSMATTRDLLTELRRRPDIVESVGRDIDALLDDAPEPEPVPEPDVVVPTTETTQWAPDWYPDPTQRFTHRYWDGDEWTDHVSSPAGQARDPLTPVEPEPAVVTPPEPVAPASSPTSTPTWADPVQPAPAAPAATSDKAAFNAGVFVALIIATVLAGIVGVIVGAINLKHPARNGQAKVLLWLGIGIIVLSLLLLGSG